MTQRLESAMRAARRAGKILENKFNTARTIKSKGKRDIVTDADYAADRAVRRVIQSRFPRDYFLSEEDSKSARAALWKRANADGAALWVVDPLDGTTNYAHHIPSFCVSLALYRAGRVELGVVYDPLRDEMFAAERGAGASLNGKPIHVSATRAFQNAVIGMEYARDPKLRARTVRVLRRVVARATSARAIGAAALSLCYVARGRTDGYFHFSLSPWDVAAAACIVEEAGGRVTTPQGNAWSVHSRAFVVSNGALHAALLKCNK
ncbi:MAG: inositol monophosphatase [Chloroflexi bacterium]|nr:inositol monophosphatase [Chloroflexota bacterium]